MHKNIFQNKIGKAFAVVAVAVMILSGSGMTWMTADAYAAVDLAQIPEYTGSPYTVINDNEPEFEADDFSTEAFENYSELDDLGRCGVAYANICQEIMPTEKRGAIGMVKPSGWHTVKYPELIKDRYLYNRCHLIGFQLAGENANTKNLITGTRYLNVDGMLPFEDEVADYVKETDNHVLYRVTPVFDGDNLVASGVQMEAESVEDDGAGVKFNVFCYNIQPGIGIDYATGIAREISEEYGVDPKRSASLLDMFTSVGQGMIPYGAQLLSAATLTGLTPVDILPNLYYPVLMGICGVGAIFLRKR